LLGGPAEQKSGSEEATPEAKSDSSDHAEEISELEDGEGDDNAKVEVPATPSPTASPSTATRALGAGTGSGVHTSSPTPAPKPTGVAPVAPAGKSVSASAPKPPAKTVVFSARRYLKDDDDRRTFRALLGSKGALLDDLLAPGNSAMHARHRLAEFRTLVGQIERVLITMKVSSATEIAKTMKKRWHPMHEGTKKATADFFKILIESVLLPFGVYTAGFEARDADEELALSRYQKNMRLDALLATVG